MSINSLTHCDSGDITFASSAQLFLNVSAVGDKNIRFDNLGLLPPPVDYGARWDCNTSQGFGSFGFRDLSPSFGSLTYDTGSWTNASSPGVFLVADDRYSHVDIGFQGHFDGTNIPELTMYFDINGGSPGPYEKFFDVTVYVHVVMQDRPVSSGDVLDFVSYASATHTIIADANNCFVWVKGTRRKQ